MRAMGRWGVLATTTLALAGCKDVGLEGKNLPHELAVTMPPKPLVEQTVRIAPAEIPGIPEGGLELNGRIFGATATEYALGDNAVRPVGAAGGASLYAMAWDEEPLDMLLVRLENGRYGVLEPFVEAVGEHGGSGHEAPGEHGGSLHEPVPGADHAGATAEGHDAH